MKEKTRLWNFTKKGSYNLNYPTFFVYVPPAWNFVVYRDKSQMVRTFYMYSSTYYINVSLPVLHTYTRVSYNPSVVAFTLPYSYNFTRLYLTELRRTLSIFYCPVFRKIKFKGKGYYIYKNARNTITPQFGYSHRLYTYAYFVTVKFLSKTSIFLFGFLKKDLDVVSLAIKSMRPINIFTGRGVRFAKQIVYKKAGKISSYR